MTKKAGGLPPPDGVSGDLWFEFCAQRKKPVTKTAYQMMLNKLAEAKHKGFPPSYLFERAIESGYETIWVPRDWELEQARQSNCVNEVEIYQKALDQAVRDGNDELARVMRKRLGG